MSQPLTVSEAAKLAGISPSALRKWSERFGWPHTRRTKSGWRQFSMNDVDIIKQVRFYLEQGYTMRQLIQNGWPVLPHVPRKPDWSVMERIPLPGNLIAQQIRARCVDAIQDRDGARILDALIDAERNVRRDLRNFTVWLPILAGLTAWESCGMPLNSAQHLRGMIAACQSAP